MDDIGDIHDMADVAMLYRIERRVRHNFMEELSDLEFQQNFRFTKDGMTQLVDLLEPHLIHHTGRGNPLTPLQQV